VTISVVQAQDAGSLPVTFSNPVTAGNTVFLVIIGATFSGATVSSSAPTLGGSSVSGSVAFFGSGGVNGINSALAGNNGAYFSIWMLPNCAGGSEAVSATVSGSAVGGFAYEISGLGASPGLDKSSSGSSSGSTAIDSGSSGAIGFAPELILGGAATFSGSGAGPSSPWANLSPNGNSWAGYQIAVSSGGSYDWAQTGSSAEPWAAGIATVRGTSGGIPHTATASLTVTPALRATGLERSPAALMSITAYSPRLAWEAGAPFTT
jgi:hypothetical protein